MQQCVGVTEDLGDLISHLASEFAAKTVSGIDLKIEKCLRGGGQISDDRSSLQYERVVIMMLALN